MNPNETRTRILAATDELFGALGFDATTTRDIAGRSGVNKALIHYHFGTKEDLLAALLDDYYARLTAELVAALGRRAGPVEQVEDVLDSYADFLAKNRTFCSIVAREIGSGRHVERIVRGTLPAFRLGTRWLRELAPRPPQGLELEHVLVSVYGMVVTYFTHGRVLSALGGADPFSPKELEARKRHVRTVARLLLHELGIGASPKRTEKARGPAGRGAGESKKRSRP